MTWLLLFLLCAGSATTIFFISRNWIVPWSYLENIIDDIKKLQQPRTYLIEGNARARRIAIALEDIFLNQLQLSRRIHEDAFSAETITGAMADGLVVLNERGEIRVSNASFRRLFALEQITPGATLLQLLRSSAVNDAVTSVLRTSREAEAEISIESDGAAFPRQVAVAAVPMRNGGGALKGAVVLFRDITDLRQTEQIRRDFVANVSHELRTPLSIFRGYLETLREEPDISRAEARHILEVMEKHSSRLNSLVQDLLCLAQLEAAGPHLNLSDVNVPALLSSIIREWEKRFRAKGLDVQLELSADLPLIRADEARLHEVFYNIFDNAVKYSDELSRVSVFVSVEDKFLRVTVKDQGRGIPATDLSRVFERFYRVDKGRSRDLGGTGLGLSIVKHIVQLHGGDVRAESELGQGTSIHVLLPAGARNSASSS